MFAWLVDNGLHWMMDGGHWRQSDADGPQFMPHTGAPSCAIGDSFRARWAGSSIRCTRLPWPVQHTLASLAPPRGMANGLHDIPLITARIVERNSIDALPGASERRSRRRVDLDSCPRRDERSTAGALERRLRPDQLAFVPGFPGVVRFPFRLLRD